VEEELEKEEEIKERILDEDDVKLKIQNKKGSPLSIEVGGKRRKI
jgi:hypothetical protein